MQESEFALLNASLPSGSIKTNWVKISQALDDVQKNRKLDAQKTKLLLEFYNATKSKGLDAGTLKAKFEASNKYDLMLQKFEKDNASLTSGEIEDLTKHLETSGLMSGISNQARTGINNYKKAAKAYSDTKASLTPALQKALENMVDTNNNNATTFQILMVDKIIPNLKDFPADKRKNFEAERARLKRQLSGYNAEHTEKSNKFLNEGIFSTIAHVVKQITQEAHGRELHVEELMTNVTITSNLLEFRTYKGPNYDPYFHQGNDFDSNKHEGILYCPSKFPTKDGTMLKADEIIVLDVFKHATNPARNHLTIMMINHEKGIVFNTYRHAYTISVQKNQKIKAGDVLGNYWKYIKTADNNDIVGYAKSTNKPNHFIGASSPEENASSKRTDFPSAGTASSPSPKRTDFPSMASSPSPKRIDFPLTVMKGAFPIYYFPNKEKGKFPYFVKTSSYFYHMLDIGKVEKLYGEDFAYRGLQFKNEHFHIERRFMSKQEYVKKHLPAQSNSSLNNINLSQSFTKHFQNHTNLKRLTLTSSFGDLIPASTLLDTNSTDSKFLLEELKKLRNTQPQTAALKKAYKQKSADKEFSKIIAGAENDAIRDYTMLLTFENIVKLACQLQNYAGGKDNCNLSQLQRQITDAKQLLVTKKFIY